MVAASVADVVDTCLTAASDLWQLNAAVTTMLPNVIIGTHSALDARGGEHSMVHVQSGLWGMALPFVFVIIDAIDVHYADVVVAILHPVCPTAASESPVALTVELGALLARALKTLNIYLVQVFQRWRAVHPWLGVVFLDRANAVDPSLRVIQGRLTLSNSPGSLFIYSVGKHSLLFLQGQQLFG